MKKEIIFDWIVIEKRSMIIDVPDDFNESDICQEFFNKIENIESVILESELIELISEESSEIFDINDVEE